MPDLVSLFKEGLNRLATGRIAHSLKSGATVAGDAFNRGMSLEEMQARAGDAASLMMLGSPIGGVGPEAGAVAASGFKPSQLRLFDKEWDLSRLPSVEQRPLPRYIPPRGVPERVTSLVSNPTVKDAMMEGIQRGVEQGGDRWYNMSPAAEDFRTVLNGSGDPAFARYMDYMAASSPMSKVGENVRNASYYYSRDRSGLGPPAVGETNPTPYGHLAQRLHQMNAQRVATKGWDPLVNPKPTSFSQNLQGNYAPGTIDTHAFRAPAIASRDPRFLVTDYEASAGVPKRNIQKEVESGQLSMDEAATVPAFWQSQPRKTEYAAMEDYYRMLAQEAGLDFGQGAIAPTQAASWVGAGEATGLGSDASMGAMDFLKDRVMRTAEESGQDPVDAYVAFIRGQQALRAGGGPGGLAGVFSNAVRPPGTATQEEFERAVAAGQGA
jgi:hypothetical protein